MSELLYVEQVAAVALELSLTVPVLSAALWDEPNTWESVGPWPYYWPLRTPNGKGIQGGPCDMRHCPHMAASGRSYWCRGHAAYVIRATNSKGMRALRAKAGKDADRLPMSRVPEDVATMVLSGGFRAYDPVKHSDNMGVMAKRFTGNTWSGEFQVEDENELTADDWLAKD